MLDRLVASCFISADFRASFLGRCQGVIRHLLHQIVRHLVVGWPEHLFGEEVRIAVGIGGRSAEWLSKPRPIKKGKTTFKDYMDVILRLPADCRQIPDLFLYLERASGTRTGQRVSFLRFNVVDFFDGLEDGQVKF